MVLDMGQPVRILDVAKTLIDLSGKSDIDIVFTGLRPGEKMSEELFAVGEQIASAGHSLINKVDVPALSMTRVQSMTFDDPEVSRSWMCTESDGAVVGVASP
jgi:FlaA1/EpsC-like NDP-sugar epimerase